MRLPFTKMHGIGNDFVVIDSATRPLSIHLTAEHARKICDRRYGIGCDQILWLKKATQPGCDARMEILNSDGSSAEMCGNGIRAVGLYLNRYSGGRSSLKIETLAGIMEIKLQSKSSVLVDMGQPTLGSADGETIEVAGKRFRFFEVGMGNPHAVIFVDSDPHEMPIEQWGPLIERHSRFPNRTNVEFVYLKSYQLAVTRVWERGAGITLACGTGACATAVAAIRSRGAQTPIVIRLPGGDLKISWEGEGHSVMMEGPAEEVFQGEIEI